MKKKARHQRNLAGGKYTFFHRHMFMLTYNNYIEMIYNI